MARKLLMGFLLVMMNLSCALFEEKYSILPDYSASPSALNQGRLETFLCGHYSVGDNICWLDSDGDFSDLTVGVVTYFSGDVTFFSEECKVREKLSYSSTDMASGLLEIPLARLIKKAPEDICIIDMTMTYRFPGQKISPVKVYGMSGRLILGVKQPDVELAMLSSRRNMRYESDDTYYKGAAILSIYEDQVMDVSYTPMVLAESHSGSYMVRGCGVATLQNDYEGEKSYPHLPVILNDILMKVPAGSHCVLYGRVVRKDKETDLVFLVAVEILTLDLNPMGIPQLQRSTDMGKLSVKTNEPVSWTIVNNKAFNLASGEVDIDPTLPFVLKQITSKGRTLVMKVVGSKIVWRK